MGSEMCIRDSVHFVPTTLGGACIGRIDHVAIGLAPDQLDTWILFSRSVLALEAGESLELADPFGLVRTCSVASADRRVRIVLNVSQSRRTRTARTVEALGGKPAVHHIAFDCADILATVAALRERGTTFVAISDNYYDDLLARFALDAALVERLRTLKTEERPLLLKINLEVGHGGASGRFDALREIAEDDVFLLVELGLAG